MANGLVVTVRAALPALIASLNAVSSLSTLMTSMEWICSPRSFAASWFSFHSWPSLDPGIAEHGDAGKLGNGLLEYSSRLPVKSAASC